MSQKQTQKGETSNFLLRTIILLPSGEKMLPDVSQSVLVLGSLISRQGCNYVQIKQPHFLEFLPPHK